MTISDIRAEPIIDEPPPPWVRRRRNGESPPAVDEAALLDAMRGGVPAEVAKYVPARSRVVDAGEFADAMDVLKTAIRDEAGRVCAALRRQADALEQGAEEQCGAIDLAVTDAHVRQQAARQMAEAFARVSEDITSQVRAILALKINPEPTAAPTEAKPEGANNDE